MSKNQFIIQEILPGLGKLNALIKNIMRQTGVKDPNEAIRLVNSRKWIISEYKPFFIERFDIIHLSFTTDGTSGFQWIERLEDENIELENYVKTILNCLNFNPTIGVKTKIAIIKGKHFKQEDCNKEKLYAEVSRLNLINPSVESACYLREMLTNDTIKAMGLMSIKVMHNPIECFDKQSAILTFGRRGDHSYLDAYFDQDKEFSSDVGFAFEEVSNAITA